MARAFWAGHWLCHHWQSSHRRQGLSAEREYHRRDDDRDSEGAPQTTSSPGRSLRSTPTRARWSGISSPHRTIRTIGTRRRRPWSSTATINGQPRKLIAQAARNGHFFVLDRTNGKALVSTEYVKTNWSTGYDAKGQPIPEPGENAADRRRAGLAQSGRRHQLAVSELQSRRPASSMSAPRARSASTTSTIRATTRWDGAERIVVAGPSR